MARSTRMISDLPGDLESEILSRVPARSLARLKTTCKRWCGLIKDPKFVKKKLGKEAEEVILLITFGVYSISVNLHGIHNNSVDPRMEFTGKLTCLKDSEDLEISQIFHCDGLILASTIRNSRLVVWNPCTGETRSIRPRNSYGYSDHYVLGYGNSTSSCRSYKILRSSSDSSDDDDQEEDWGDEIDIYEFSSDSWRVLDGLTDKWTRSAGAVSMKGNTYLIYSDTKAGGVHVLLSFDFTTERYVSFPLPYHSNDPGDNVVLSVVRGEQLALLYQTFASEIKVWLSNKIDEAKEVSWSNFLVVDLEKFMLPSYTEVVDFLVDEENKVVVCCGKNLKNSSDSDTVYIVGEDLHKLLCEENAKLPRFSWPRLLSYVPSLVQIPKAKES